MKYELAISSKGQAITRVVDIKVITIETGRFIASEYNGCGYVGKEKKCG